MGTKVIGLMLSAAFMVSSPAWALFNVQAFTGKRSSKLNQDQGSSGTLQGNELRFAAHVDPIPLVPVAFGLGWSQTQFHDSSQKLNLKKMDGEQLDLEVEAWLPLDIAGLLPYAKVSYALLGEYKANSLDVAPNYSVMTKYKPSGFAIHAGVKYEFFARLGVMAEVSLGKQKLKYDEQKGNFDNQFAVSKGDIDETSTSVLLGLQAGI